MKGLRVGGTRGTVKLVSVDAAIVEVTQQTKGIALQCTQFVDKYLSDLSLPNISGNAIDWLKNPAVTKYTGNPKTLAKGDVGIFDFGSTVGSSVNLGHVAIIKSIKGGYATIEGANQVGTNLGAGSPASVETVPLADLKGFINVPLLLAEKAVAKLSGVARQFTLSPAGGHWGQFVHAGQQYGIESATPRRHCLERIGRRQDKQELPWRGRCKGRDQPRL